MSTLANTGHHLNLLGELGKRPGSHSALPMIAVKRGRIAADAGEKPDFVCGSEPNTPSRTATPRKTRFAACCEAGLDLNLDGAAPGWRLFS